MGHLRGEPRVLRLGAWHELPNGWVIPAGTGSVHFDSVGATVSLIDDSTAWPGWIEALDPPPTLLAARAEDGDLYFWLVAPE